MIRKSIKYIIIALINLIILSVLLWFWTDFIEITFNNWVRPIEFLKLIGITIASLIAMRISVSFFRQKEVNSIKSRLIISILITLLISSYFYIDYSLKVFQNNIQNRELRKSLAKKIEFIENGPLGTKAKNLTLEEYNEITKTNWFPKIQKESKNIIYHYSYDGFLPDYSFEVKYDILLQEKVDSTNLKYGEIRVDTIKNLKRITYNEYEY
ncbi:hypothetical protein [uncultured Christiangramia sp.]|uniref:hypothetical protein n=1 Tax=uncultured Christiangramia sp. TaxID=503836 RepID=UPI002632E93C|nr:hypothetical protein [uncultured Christiangramia sp.]